MNSFKKFLENYEFTDRIILEFNSISAGTPVQKPWSAKKSEIMQMWRNFRPDIPILIQPLQEKPKGSNRTNYGEDGIRITGSFNFISSVLSRLKEIISYENPETKLRLVFRGIDRNKSRPDRQSFAFYVNVENRGKGRKNKKI